MVPEEQSKSFLFIYLFFLLFVVSNHVVSLILYEKELRVNYSLKG